MVDSDIANEQSVPSQASIHSAQIWVMWEYQCQRIADCDMHRFPPHSGFMLPSRT
jgi:hypothetical protein